MTNSGSMGNSKGQIDRLIAAATNTRDKAFIALLARDGLRISEAVQINVSDIDFNKGTLTIVHLKERSKLKCPECRAILGCLGARRGYRQAGGLMTRSHPLHRKPAIAARFRPGKKCWRLFWRVNRIYWNLVSRMSARKNKRGVEKVVQIIKAKGQEDKVQVTGAMAERTREMARPAPQQQPRFRITPKMPKLR